MQDPPVVRLPHHPSGAGRILQWKQRPDRSWEALVEYVIDVPGWRGGLQPPEQSWMPAHEVEQVPGEDYRKVPRTRARRRIVTLGTTRHGQETEK